MTALTDADAASLLLKATAKRFLLAKSKHIDHSPAAAAGG
jgi:hypothetical protein